MHHSPLVGKTRLRVLCREGRNPSKETTSLRLANEKMVWLLTSSRKEAKQSVGVVACW